MHDLLPSGPALTAFIAASVVLAVTPGPGVLYIVTRSLAQGRRSGLASVGGVALGNLGNALVAALGLAAVFAVSSLAFSIVKYLGAAYLIYLGVQVLLRSSPRAAVRSDAQPQSLAKVFRDGFIVALFNPKTALFFAALLPQFMPAGASAMQSIVLGALFVAIAASTDTLYALAAGTIAPALERAAGGRAYGSYLHASVFIGLGLLTAWGGSRATK